MKIVRVFLLMSLVVFLFGCQSSGLEGYLQDLEQRLLTLENPPQSEEDSQYLEDFRNLESRVLTLEQPNPYLIAAGIFYDAYLRMEVGDKTGEAAVLNAVLFDEELTDLWHEVVIGQKATYTFMFMLWTKAFEVKAVEVEESKVKWRRGGILE